MPEQEPPIQPAAATTSPHQPRSRDAPEQEPGTGGHASLPVSESMESMLARSHNDLGTFDMDGIDVPLILFDDVEYAKALHWYNASLSKGWRTISTGLNIMQDYMGHVFVDVVLTFGNGETLKVLINANRQLAFFQRLAGAGVLAVGTNATAGDTIMIQMPKMYRAEEALHTIEDGLAAGRGR